MKLSHLSPSQVMQTIFKRSSFNSRQRLGWLAGSLALLLLSANTASFLLFPVQPARADKAGVCAVPGKDGIGTISGIVNTYYAGSGTAAAGSSSLTLGAIRTGTGIPTTPLAPGDLVLIVQMQNATINSTNTDSYGDNLPGGSASGSTGGTAGIYEYAVVSSVSGSTIAFTNPLVNTYTQAPASATQGQQTYQVVRIPQYSSATISSTAVKAAPWNNSTGGIVAFDVAGALNLGGGTIDVNGQGFRGGGSAKQGYSGGNKTDYVSAASTSPFEPNASKGEGIAGTPRLTINQPTFNDFSTTTITDSGTQGYPGGDFARGAPGNAGGGGNEHNSGGGGGANGGAGGTGGRNYTRDTPATTNLGGFGGAALSANPARLVLGGGGGAGDMNDQAVPSGAGGNGGGLVMVRADSVSGTGTINANGGNGDSSAAGTTPDAGGGGGAAGTVLITAANGTLPSSLTINAKGGNGGNLDENNTNELDGPGAGGGGGLVYTNTSGPTLGTTGGAAGVIQRSSLAGFTGNSNGATAGGNGSGNVIDTATQLPTSISGAACLPSLTVTKTTSTPEVANTSSGTTAIYKITVQNNSGKGAAQGITISDNTLPTGFTYASTSSIDLIDPTSSNFKTTRNTVSNPTVGVNNPSWGQFTIPNGGKVEITFTVNIPASAIGTYQNPATATYADPVRTTTAGTTTVSYNQTKGEDVIVSSALLPLPPTPAATAPTVGGVCANPGQDGPATISGTVNTYYPGTGSASAGNTSITLGDAVGASTPIARGDLLLVMQMQDASIDSSNTASYGSGNTANNGSGQTSMGNSGIYEYVVATNDVPLTGGTRTLTFRGAGSGNGLVNSYTDAAATTSSGQRRFQVVRVPQYANVTLSSTLTALEWNGRTGGIVALDVAGDLNFNGSTINTYNRGFRAGYLQKTSSLASSTNSYVGPVPANINTAMGAGKGESTLR